MFLIIRGYSSSYQIWNYIKKNPDKSIKPMAYNNTNKRILILCGKGYLEEVSQWNPQQNLHGRKDYKISKKGMEYLISYILFQSGSFEDISKYLDEMKFDRETFEGILGPKILNILESASSYYAPIPATLSLRAKRLGYLQIGIKEPKLAETIPISQVKNVSRRKKTPH
jgi:hypothetical protein